MSSTCDERPIWVCKRGGRGSCRQKDINTVMGKLGTQGKYVVRLKPGNRGIVMALSPGLSTLGLMPDIRNDVQNIRNNGQEVDPLI